MTFHRPTLNDYFEIGAIVRMLKSLNTEASIKIQGICPKTSKASNLANKLYNVTGDIADELEKMLFRDFPNDGTPDYFYGAVMSDYSTHDKQVKSFIKRYLIEKFEITKEDFEKEE